MWVRVCVCVQRSSKLRLIILAGVVADGGVVASEGHRVLLFGGNKWKPSQSSEGGHSGGTRCPLCAPLLFIISL